MAHSLVPTRTALAAALLGCCLAPRAQTATESITITGRSESGPSVAGFADVPLARSPLQAHVVGSEQLADTGVQAIGGLSRLDASVGDAYNADGYWSMLSVRGYTLDNRYNYRRDGLPINAETAIPLDNKERLELLKGTSGIQAGSSSPGGLVNLVVKRPVAGQRGVTIEARDSGNLLGAVDIGDRSADGVFGWRLNAAAERLDPPLRDSAGQRWLLALAGDWQIGAATLLQAEVESSHQSQPSAAGFSMRGNTVPDAHAIDPRLNLNDQPWNKPVVLDGNTASLRLLQRLNEDWRLRVHALTQHLKSDDRTAFPYGVYDADSYECAQWCDRFAPDGTFTYWQYVSDNERRNSDAVDAALNGRAHTGAVEHTLEGGVLQTRYSARFEDQIFDIAGTGRDDGSLVTPPSPGYPDANTNRDERSTEFYLRDAMRLGSTSLWAGVRHTRLKRSSVRTSPADDGLRPTSYEQSATIPWLALAQQLTPSTLIYASWGQGLESDVAPNRARYTNSGQALPALKSRQVEAGLKYASDAVDAAVTAFDIDRPQSADIGACDADASCTYAIDGSARHRGVEAQLALRQGAWDWHAGAMLLDAERRGSVQPGINGSRPVNVPRATLRLAAAYRVPTLPGLELQSALVAQSDRVVLPYDTSVRIPGWGRLDLGARWAQRVGATTVTWRAGVDNATDRRAWREAPYQFGHVYLYPLQPRTWRASATVAF